MTTINIMFTMLIVFQIKHLVADYYLQFPYMYENKGKQHEWFIPLSHHALIHSGLTLMILSAFGALHCPEASTETILSVLVSGALFDLVTHFATDRWKATRGRVPTENKFWHDLGVDQMIHHVVGIIIVYGFAAWTL